MPTAIRAGWFPTACSSSIICVRTARRLHTVLPTAEEGFLDIALCIIGSSRRSTRWTRSSAAIGGLS